MRRRLAAGVVLALLVLATGFVATRAAARPRTVLTRELPRVTYATSAGPRELRADASATVVVLFDTRCGHCHAALDALNQAIDSTGATRFVLLTAEPILADSLVRANWPHLSATPRVSWGTIPTSVAAGTFGLRVTPTFYVYDSAGHLVDEIRGEARPAFLLKKLGGFRGPA